MPSRASISSWAAVRLPVAACAAIVALAVLPAASFGAYGFQAKWGTPGGADGQLNLPTGVDTNDLDDLYVADFGNNRVQRFSADGDLLTLWGTTGSGVGEFRQPYDIATDSSGNVYVADGGNDRVQKFGADGSYLGQFGSSCPPDPPCPAGQFNIPTSVSIDGSENVYVTDWGNHRVQKFDSSGGFLAQWGSSGSAAGEFSNPAGIEVDDLGNVYVADYGNNRVQKFTSGGAFLGQWGVPGAGDGQFDHPTGVAVDGLGSVLVVDRDNNRVQRFDSSGAYLAQFGGAGAGDGQFTSPWGITTGSLQTAFVSDSANGRVQRFGESQAGSTVRRSGTRLVFQARPGKQNAVSVSLASGQFTFTDSSDAVLAGAGCTMAGPNSATCAAASITSLRLRGDDLDDDLSNGASTPASIEGGTGDDQLAGGSGGDTLAGDAGDDDLTGGGSSEDVASYAGATAAVTVSLAAAGAQATGGAGTDTLAGIERLTGSAHADDLAGDGGDNAIDGGAGDDTVNGGGGADSLDGGGGADTASYAGSGSAVGVFLSLSGAQNTGGAGLDTLDEIEDLLGSSSDDTLSGDTGPNTLNGGAGNDVLVGGLGDDTLNGSVGTADLATYAAATAAVDVDLANAAPQATGVGTDTLAGVENLTGGPGNDSLNGNGAANTISGGSGNDELEGGPGNDALNGGLGTDAASYSSAPAGVTVDLSDAAGSTGSPQDTAGAGTDTLSNMEGLAGSDHGDQLLGNDNANALSGADGDDTLRGAGANDTLTGGAGADTADYSDAFAGVTVDLSATGSQDTGGSGSDTLGGVESLVGSAHADTLTGSSAVNDLAGGDGDDTLRLVDSVADTAHCGTGTDAATADVLDTVDPDCESLTIGAPPAPPAGGGPAPVPADSTRPVLSGLAALRIRAGIGGTFTFAVSEPATVSFAFERMRLGRRVRGKCVRATRRNRTKRSCRRYSRVGSVAHRAIAGQNAYAFNGRVAGRMLAAGPYRVIAVATDAAGNRSPQVSIKVAVLR